MIESRPSWDGSSQHFNPAWLRGLFLMVVRMPAVMSEYEIELVSKRDHSVIGEANDLESALNCLDDAIREYPNGHIRVRRGTAIISERVPPRAPT
jgi:hypothetical protein